MADREQIIQWLISRRRALNDKRQRQRLLKPLDQQSFIRIGIKMRALQEVINYLIST